MAVTASRSHASSVVDTQPDQQIRTTRPVQTHRTGRTHIAPGGDPVLASRIVITAAYLVVAAAILIGAYT